MDYREEFINNNPDKTCDIQGLVGTGYGTHRYKCTWQGNWQAEELINFCDNSEGNYGGRIEDMRRLDDGKYEGIVCVYYD